MKLQTEPIGSVPRPTELIDALTGGAAAAVQQTLTKEAIRATIASFEETGSEIITDGEQAKPSFVTYPIHGADYLSPGGVRIDFADGHFRQLPYLTKGPFKFTQYAVDYLKHAQGLTKLPVKQAVISASALSLLYPPVEIADYPHAAFIKDLIDECEKDIRLCLEAGAEKVQVDFTEGRLSLKLDPSAGLLKQFIDLNNAVFDRFSDEEKKKLGVHVCPGGDKDSTHSADVPYEALLAHLFEMHVGNFYLQLAGESDRRKVLAVVKEKMKSNQTVFVGVTDVINAKVETAEEVRDRVLEAAEFIPVAQLGTTDDCGFSPFCDDHSTSRSIAFAKIKARIDGTKLAEAELSKR